MLDLATVLVGALPFKEGNVNDTYRGQVLLSDGTTRQAILKDLDEKQLANELFVSVLAKSLGLPTPEIFLAEAKRGVLALQKGPATTQGKLCLASADVQVPNLTFKVNVSSEAAKEVIYRDLQAWGGLGSLIAFDTWVANVDRHGGNLLVGGKGDYWLIDHGHCLTGSTWTPATLDPGGSYTNQIADWAKPRFSDQERVARAKDIDKCTSEMHSLNVGVCRTTARVDEVLTPQDCEAAETFVQARKGVVAKQAKGSIGVDVLA